MIDSLKGEESRTLKKKETKQKEREEVGKRKEETHQKFLVILSRKLSEKFTDPNSFIFESGNIKVPK